MVEYFSRIPFFDSISWTSLCGRNLGNYCPHPRWFAHPRWFDSCLPLTRAHQKTWSTRTGRVIPVPLAWWPPMHLCLISQLPAFTTLAPEDFNSPLLFITDTSYLSGGYASTDIYISTWKINTRKDVESVVIFETNAVIFKKMEQALRFSIKNATIV